jgi:HAD superfamily hydrolase (TIGR01509 family)
MTDGALRDPVASTLVFDFGGVVQELMDDAIIRSLVEKLGSPFDQFLAYYKKALPQVQVGRVSEEQFLSDLNKSMGNTTSPLSSDLLISPFLDGSHLYPEMTRLLDELQEKKVEIAVLSNTIPSHARLNRQRNNYHWFGENVFLSCEIGLLKPDPESFEYVANQLDRQQKQLILIDDNEKNIASARAVEITALRHDSKIMPIDRLKVALRNLGIPVCVEEA